MKDEITNENANISRKVRLMCLV